MSLIAEIHKQRPIVRHTMFVLAATIAVSGVVYMTTSSIQKDIYFAMNPDPEDQQAFLEQREADRPKPLAALSHAAGALMASIGSLIGWDTDAGFDRGDGQDTLQGDAHLLPLSQ